MVIASSQHEEIEGLLDRFRYSNALGGCTADAAIPSDFKPTQIEENSLDADSI